MSLSTREKDRRHEALRKWMKENGTDLLMVFGDTGDWGLRYGHLRYLTNGKVIFGNAVLIFPLEQEPVLLMSSALQANWTGKLSWISDTRPSTDFISDTIRILKSTGLKDITLGVANPGSLPLSWHQALIRENPSIHMTDTGPAIARMRSIKGEEEIALLQRSARLADRGFDQIIQEAGSGMTEFEILALLEKAMREEGGDDFFDLIFSGPFGPGINMMPFSPSGRIEAGREIRKGDSLLFEITPRYGGYWTQLVRIVNVGKENALLAHHHRVIRDSIEAALRFFEPGRKVSEAVNEAKKVAESAGYEFRFPTGHYCGLDVVESRIGAENHEILQPGMVMIFHPCVGIGGSQVFSGETYVITPQGYQCLHQAPTELLTIS
ncbi:MAG: Xaa-Pro peptidase family protein [Pseudomonadota bacterium]